MKHWKCRACGRISYVMVDASPSTCGVCGFGLFDEVDAKTARRMDPVQAEANKEAALARVDAAADPEWKKKARDAIRIVACQQPELTTDDVWKLVPATRENRALGALMTEAARAGIVALTEKTTKSARPGCNRRPVRVWKSLVFVSRAETR